MSDIPPPGSQHRYERKLERLQEKTAAARVDARRHALARWRPVALGVAVVGTMVAGLWWLAAASTPVDERSALLEFTMREHTNPAAHYHANLGLRLYGAPVAEPANVGITGLGMRVIHTHDASGEIHIESPRPFDFTLGDFFTVWGKPFSAQCLLDNCMSYAGSMTMLVNNATSTEYGNYIMRDGDRIELILE